MRIRFTKMQGAGNDFVVLDETRAPLQLSEAQYRFLADRHRGVGADQILSVRAARSAQVDFEYAIHNADGREVEHCGNGARCFLSFVRANQLTHKDRVRVQTMNRVIELYSQPDGRVTVDMGGPVFESRQVPFEPAQRKPRPVGSWQMWPLDLSGQPGTTEVAVLSMGNPHAVCIVDDLERIPVAITGPLIESHPCFPKRVNAGFMQLINRTQIALRVYERGAGETLSCGTGACAAVVAGIRLGLLDAQVDVATRGGRLSISWAGEGSPVMMTGPATHVFEGQIELPEQL